MIRLQEVTPDNWRLRLNVANGQKAYVADNMTILARAYAYRESRSKAFIIYNDEQPVGMALYYDCEPLEAYEFNQLMIDERYQGQGFGASAARQILEMMKQDGKYDKVILCYIEGNVVAKKLYEKLGFKPTGECDEDEIIMQLKF